MKNIRPVLPDTTIDARTKEWIPSSFDGFLRELNHIAASCQPPNAGPLFRGHCRREWLLDSTFARFFKTALLGVQAGKKLSKRVVESAELNLALLNSYLLKFGVLARPSSELEAVAAQHGVDAWFELMKRYQQYPGEDVLFLKGTNLLDWTQSPDVALYFANDKRDGDGAIYICDPSATGKTLQVIPVGEILDKMSAAGAEGKPLGCPLLFCPPKQIKCQKAENQQARYFAQMDLRFDLETIWRLREKEPETETIIVKLILPAGSEVATREFLAEKKITDSFIFPDE